MDHRRDLGQPGEFPYTRGPYAGMYRTRIWTRRFQVGFGSPQETNQRIRYLHANGANGFVITIDLPTSYGFDSDDAIADGEVGVTGVAISTLEDMAGSVRRFRSRPGLVRAVDPSAGLVVSPWPCSPASRRTRACRLRTVIGTQQNDPFFQMSGGPLQTITAVLPARRHSATLPRQHRVHLHADAAPELDGDQRLQPAGDRGQRDPGRVYTLGHAFDIFRSPSQRGLDIDTFPRKASFFLSASIDFFEEIAKFRAMRRIYARTMQRAVRRDEPRVLASAVLGSDRRQHADHAAAGDQHRARCVRGDGGRVRRSAVDALVLLRRRPWPADRGIVANSAANPAGARLRDRRDQDHRSARRLVVRRGADRPDGAARSCKGIDEIDAHGWHGARDPGTAGSKRRSTRRGIATRTSSTTTSARWSGVNRFTIPREQEIPGEGSQAARR